MADERWSNDSAGTEVSGGAVHRDFHDVSRPDGTTHHTESVTTERGSSRMSWDTDSNGKNSNFHSNNN